MSIPRHPGHFFRAALPSTPLHRSCYGAAIDPELNRPCSIAVELSLSRRRDATTTPYDRRTVFRCPFRQIASMRAGLDTGYQFSAARPRHWLLFARDA